MDMDEIDDYGEIRRPEHNELPGRPPKSLLKKVRSVLWQYLRCRPHRTDSSWRMAWEWASACAVRDGSWIRTKSGKKWPLPSEIASQYLLLALAEMRQCHALRLPFRAAETVPASIAQRFGAISTSQQVALIEQR
jgi:hypothetical protein